jgi:hypothetical protein
MIESLVGLSIMVVLTTFMASLVQLAAEVLQPKPSLTESQKSVILQYLIIKGDPYSSAAQIAAKESSVAKYICELQLDSTKRINQGCQ